MKRITSLFTCLLFLALLEAAFAEGIRIYEPASCWDDPDLVSASKDSLLFPDPVTGHYTSRSFYYTGLTSDGHLYIINIFHG